MADFQVDSINSQDLNQTGGQFTVQNLGSSISSDSKDIGINNLSSSVQSTSVGSEDTNGLSPLLMTDGFSIRNRPSRGIVFPY